MLRSKHVVRAAALCALAACSSDAGNPFDPTAAGPAYAIVDAAHAGSVTGFYFLPPMVKQPAYSGTFDASVSPRVGICELAGAACGATIAQWTMSTGITVSVAAEAYQVNWHTDEYALELDKHYRITVDVDGFVLGFADVDVVASGKELKNVQTDEYIPLLDGRTLPIKFRIETGIAAQVVVSPDSAAIPVGGTQQFTASVTDLHGNQLPTAPVAWSSSHTDVATVDGTGLASGVSPGHARIIATSGVASGDAALSVFNPNTPPVAQPDTFEAIGNVTVPVAAPGVLANDTDPDDDALQAVAGTFPTTAGGTVTLSADGSFTYLSAPGFTGTDAFTYTVTDGVDSATATATVTSAYRVWYVDNAAAGPGDGRDASPFSGLAGAEDASTAGETVFVRTGTAPYGGGFALKTGQSLTGQGVPADVTATLNAQTVVLLAAGTAPAVTRATGPAIQLASNNVVQGLDVTSAAGAGIAGSGFGTLAVGSVSVSATGGAAVDLSSGDVAASFGALSSAASTGAGIRLAAVGGSFSAAAGTITGSAGAGIDLTGGAGNVFYGGDVAVTGPLAVSVNGRTGGSFTFGGDLESTGQGISVENNSGGTVAFTGGSKSLSTGANPGVRLADNGGTAISFGGGGLVIGTTTGTGFSATGGGSVTVTGAGNTVTSAGGVAVRVENTTIGAAGLTFRSVSATGGSNGIVLSNTGALNGMQVTGTGLAGSGGTITAVTGPDGSNSGIGVYLDGARNVILSYMSISDASNFAIRGVGVNGFTLTGTVVSGANGTSAVLDEGSIAFDELTGTAAVTGSSVSGGFVDNFRVINTQGTLNRITISSTTFGANGATDGDNALHLEARNAAVLNATVQNSTFTGSRGNAVEVRLLGTSTSDLVLSGNTISGGHPSVLAGASAVLVSSGPNSAPTLAYAISHNAIRDAVGSAVVVAKGSTGGTFSGTVANNTIGLAGVANSGSAQGSGIDVSLIGGGVHTVAVTGNEVRQFNNFGIFAGAGNAASGGNGTLNATITGNTVAEPGTAGFVMNGLHLNAGTNTGDAHVICFAASGNSITGAGGNGGTDFRLRQRFLTTVRLPGYAGANNDNAGVAAFVRDNNGGTPTGAAANTVSTGGGGFVGGAACPQP